MSYQAKMFLVNETRREPTFLIPVNKYFKSVAAALNTLHICLFLMSYGNGYRSVGDSEAIVSYNHMEQSVQQDVL